ncbi:MAG TPA: hypothetical protein VE594_04450 [Nitrososphaeraceae archaeon]|nr:hypothetical protein [Nitrososphaeraceae archaeon]
MQKPLTLRTGEDTFTNFLVLELDCSIPLHSEVAAMKKISISQSSMTSSHALKISN